LLVAVAVAVDEVAAQAVAEVAQAVIALEVKLQLQLPHLESLLGALVAAHLLITLEVMAALLLDLV
jgi:hypothetical protein